MRREQGGRRKGAGAPKGNKNAVRTGQFSKDPAFRAFLQSLSPEQLKLADGSPRAAWNAASQEAQSPEDLSNEQVDSERVRPLSQGPSLHSPQPPVTEQSNQTGRLRTATDRLRELYLMGAEAFVRDHWPVISVIERLLDDIDQTREAAPHELSGVTSIAALFRSMFHEEVKRETNDYVFCPYCSWRKEREPGARAQRGLVV